MRKIVLFSFALAMAFTLKAQSVNIIFQVDFTNYLASGLTINPNGQWLAGSFGSLAHPLPSGPGQWLPGDPAGYMTQVGTSNTYQLELDGFTPGDMLAFKFLNNNDWGSCDTTQECAYSLSCDQAEFAGDNRNLTIPSSDATLWAMFDSCSNLTLTNVINVNAPKVNSLYPNPANEKANLVYTSNVNGKVQIYISNLVGQVIKTVFNGTQTQGGHTQSIDVSSLSNGVYFLTLKVNDQSVARKFNVMN